MPQAFESVEELAGWLGLMRNDLQAPAIGLAPQIGDVIETLAGEPETLIALATRNGVRLPYADANEVRRAYSFDSLKSFLDLPSAQK